MPELRPNFSEDGIPGMNPEPKINGADRCPAENGFKTMGFQSE
jgi:hypothetical protein